MVSRRYSLVVRVYCVLVAGHGVRQGRLPLKCFHRLDRQHYRDLIGTAKYLSFEYCQAGLCLTIWQEKR